MIPTGFPARPAGMTRLVGGLVRRAEAGLVYGAARNAAAGIADGRAQRLEELRTLRDLRAIEAAAADVSRTLDARALDARGRRAAVSR